MTKLKVNFPPKQTVPYLIVTVSRLVTAHYMAGIERTGVAPAQTYVLRELMQLEPQSQVDLARNLEVSKPSIGETLARLASAELIERQRSKEDRRLMMISLTDKARAMKQDLVARSHTQLEVVRDILGQDDEAVLAGLLSRLADGLKGRLDNGEDYGLANA